jgi:hypothetical protein
MEALQKTLFQKWRGSLEATQHPRPGPEDMPSGSLFISAKREDIILSLSIKRGIDRVKLLVDNNANVKAEDKVNLRVLPLTHTSSIFSRCCRIAGTPLCLRV